MIFEALPARYGDSLLLTVPDGGAKRLMVIDGGPGTVYEKSLAPALAKLASAGRPLDIDAVMVSHVDEDHILGVTQLFQAIQKAKVGNKMPPYRVRQLMFNGFDKIIAAPPAELAGPGSVLSSIADALDIGLSGHAAEVLASVGQGSTLSSVAAGLGVPLNLDARPEGELMMLDADPLTFALGESSFMIVGPRRKELDDLRREWEKWRKAQDKKAALKVLAAYADTSIANLSSIVALTTWKEKTMLLTGDARGDYVLEGLEVAGILRPGETLARPLDILKLPHHGSSRNVAPKFFERLPARHYVASGDGWFGNPDRATLEMIREARPDNDYTLHLTYTPEHMDAEHTRYLASKQKTFDAAEHSVIPAVKALQDAGVTVKFGPVRIDLATD